jgi:hypothetical protein
VTRDPRAWLVFACRNSRGRFQGDPVFEAVTEHRQSPGYSGCGDLAHWMLCRLGVRLAWLNRAEFQGWKVTQNLSLLASVESGGRNPVARRPVYGELLEPGDVLVLATRDPKRSHVVVVAAPAELRLGGFGSAEYGQWATELRRASGALFDRTFVGAPVRIGERSVDSILKLADVLAAARAAGTLLDPDDLGDYAARWNRCRTLRLWDHRMTGDDVGLVQRATGAVVDYVYGPKTAEAVRAFQRSHGLVDDGVTGPKTWAVIG